METSKYVYHSNKWWWGESCDIIRNNGSAIVCVKFDNDFPKVAYICGLSVEESYRQMGYGKSMMNEALDLAKLNEKSFARLHVDKTKDWLIEMYEDLGFEIFSKDEHEYEMIKMLD